MEEDAGLWDTDENRDGSRHKGQTASSSFAAISMLRSSADPRRLWEEWRTACEVWGSGRQWVEGECRHWLLPPIHGTPLHLGSRDSPHAQLKTSQTGTVPRPTPAPSSSTVLAARCPFLKPGRLPRSSTSPPFSPQVVVAAAAVMRSPWLPLYTIVPRWWSGASEDMSCRGDQTGTIRLSCQAPRLRPCSPTSNSHFTLWRPQTRCRPLFKAPAGERRQRVTKQPHLGPARWGAARLSWQVSSGFTRTEPLPAGNRYANLGF